MRRRDNHGVSVRSIRSGEGVGAQRGDAVVCICGPSGDDGVRSVLAHTPDDVPILVCEDVGEAIAAAAPADVVLLRPGCIVADGWLAGLREAAYVDARVATAMALTNDGALTPSAPTDDRAFDDAAAAVRAGSLRLRPRVQTVGGPCTYVRRSALELVSDVDPASSWSAGEATAFSERCLDSGLCHVVADDVLVTGRGASRAAADWQVASSGPVARSLGAARRALNGLSVVIDARILTGPMNGTHVHVLELIAALGRTERATVTAVVPPDLSVDARVLLEGLPGVALTAIAPGADLVPAIRADIVHRPFQIASPADLTFLAQLGDRLLVTHQDLISYHNPSYFPSPRAWSGYRDLTRRALGAADQVLFFSAHARDDAIAEDLVEPHRASVVHIGVDHAVTRMDTEDPLGPRGTEPVPEDAEVMLCLGSDYRHKNRIFALAMLDELQRRHDWPGWLVLAGPHATFGSSLPDEDRMLAARPQLRERLLRLGAVSEAEKTWLLRRANLMLYPTVHEGFGLIPFEAADYGVPCLWAPGTALGEVLPESAAGIVPWDAGASGQQAIELMRDEDTASRNVDAIRAAAGALSWDTTATRLIGVYQSVCNQPLTPASALERGRGLMAGGMSEDAMRLVGPGGALPREFERSLLALATHPKLAAPVFCAIRAGYRVSYRLRRSGLSQNGTDA